MFQIVRIFATLIIILLSPMATANVVFPLLTADDLNGRSLNLPADFPGTPTIVLIAYKRNQQPSIDAWVERLGLRENEGPAWVELPVVGRGAAFFRSFVDKGMRSGITSLGMRARTITIYSSRSAFNLALGIAGRREIYVALVDPDGTVHALIKGDVTETKVQKLRAAYP
tara:strand:+ start:334 stop:843 length:510 start_codon:yes stop_codon:yes gene_type:complete